ncbi:MAG TPA: Ig-like domain-containing protein, partial [Myxococcales bacterium]|nr:Ig-like domain-containing protein [Myxococcales bacterium]
MRARAAILVQAVALLSSAALAQTAPVGAIFPVVPVRPGATLIELGFAAEGAEQLRVDVRATSLSAGVAGQVLGAVVARDRSGLVPFHLSVPLASPFAEDGTVEVTARALSANGTAGDPATARFSTADEAAAFESGIFVAASQDGSLTVSLSYSGSLSRSDVAVMGTAASRLRAVGGNLKAAAAGAFANANLSIRPRTPDGTLSFSVPLQAGTSIPPDGVVVVDAALVDAFGRVVHSSAVQFTGSGAFDQLLSLSASPSPVLLTLPFQRAPLAVSASFLLGGTADVSGPDKGVQYTSRNPDVALVTAGGEVVAQSRGETDVDVAFGKSSVSVHVIVDPSATVDHLEISPALAHIDHVGGTATVKLTGILTTGSAVDLTGMPGCGFASSDPATISIDDRGTATARRPGVVTVSAVCGALGATAQVDAADAPPAVRLLAPASVAAGGNLEVLADATDDVAIDRVQFFLNGAPAGTVS